MGRTNLQTRWSGVPRNDTRGLTRDTAVPLRTALGFWKSRFMRIPLSKGIGDRFRACVNLPRKARAGREIQAPSSVPRLCSGTPFGGARSDGDAGGMSRTRGPPVPGWFGPGRRRCIRREPCIGATVPPWAFLPSTPRRFGSERGRFDSCHSPLGKAPSAVSASASPGTADCRAGSLSSEGPSWDKEESPASSIRFA